MYNTRKKRGISSAPDKKREDQIMQQHVQQEAMRLSIEHKLGRLKREYDTRYGFHPLFIAALQLLFLGLLTYFLFSSLQSLQTTSPQSLQTTSPQSLQAPSVSGNEYCCITKVSFSDNTNQPVSPLGFLIFVSLGGLVVSIFIFFCWNYWRRYPLYHSQQFLYEHGFLLIACRGKRIIGSDVLRWRDIGTIWHTFFYNGDANSKSESYIIQDCNGTVFGSRIIKPLKELGRLRPFIQRFPLIHVNHSAPPRSPRHEFDGELGKEIERLALPYLLPRALATFAQGIPVRFGSLILHTRGIEYQGKLLPWHEFDRSRLVYHPSTDKEPETLYFLKQEGQKSWLRSDWAVVSCSQIPNFALLHRLIIAITGSPPPVSCIPLVAGKPAMLTYHGYLAATASSITMHWGYNNWNSITDTHMMKQGNGTWQATISIPSNATIVNIAFYNQSGVWDNNKTNNYNLRVS